MDASSRTERAVRGWLTALPATLYDVRIVPADDDGPALRRRVSASGMLRLLPWLRAMNARKHHVYARPASSIYVMIDDLDEDGLDALRADGHRAAAVVITSPANHQAWLRLPGSEGAISAELSSAVARLAARHFDGDIGAASSVQVGRLPGFTNSKAIYADRYGRHPFVLLRAAAGGVDWKGRELLQAAGAELAASDVGNVTVAGAGSDTLPQRRLGLRACTPEQEWDEGHRRVSGRLSDGYLDRSRLDYAIAQRLHSRGAGKDYIRAVLRSGERAQEKAPSAHVYVERTLVAAADSSRWRRHRD